MVDFGAVLRMAQLKLGICGLTVEILISAVIIDLVGDPFAVSQNNTTIYLFDYFIFLGLRGGDDREAVKNLGCSGY